jgi:methylglutaconyl-CoA hydratase
LVKILKKLLTGKIPSKLLHSVVSGTVEIAQIPIFSSYCLTKILMIPDMLSKDVSNGVAEIKLSRPEKRNALSRNLIENLLGEIRALRIRSDIRLLILSAEGPSFCAGMDLDEMQSRAQSADGKSQWLRDSEIYCELLESVFGCSFPTVVQLQGPVLAGGVGLVLACDLIVASNTAFFSLPEPVRGITAAIVTPLLVHRVGQSAAAQLLLSGERVSADRAWQLGLIHAVVSSEELPQRLTELKNSILTGSPSALAITKQHLNACSAVNVIDQLRLSIPISAQARETSDAREGLAAFLEKRKPAWQASIMKSS